MCAYDRRGRGGSGRGPAHTVEREIEDLDALIGVAGGSASVFGHSSDGALSLEAAARGLAISRLAVYEPPYIVDDTRSRPVGLRERAQKLLDDGRPGEALELFFGEGVDVPPQGVAAGLAVYRLTAETTSSGLSDHRR